MYSALQRREGLALVNLQTVIIDVKVLGPLRAEVLNINQKLRVEFKCKGRVKLECKCKAAHTCRWGEMYMPKLRELITFAGNK
jgi:hypothetical protein